MDTDYTRAIKAYQFQVERYHTWMNYYSIFNGALFIALYTLLDNEQGNKEMILTVISLLGYVTALCWLGTVIGNRAWMDSWVQIIQMIEANSSGVEYKIYKLLHSNGNTKKFLSTQKLMQVFTFFVCLAWACIACFAPTCKLNPVGCCGVSLFAIIAVFMYYCSCPCIHSNISDMEILD